MRKNDKLAAYREMPLWVQLFLIHVVKRSLGVLNTWIEEVQEANREPMTTEQGNSNYR